MTVPIFGLTLRVVRDDGVVVWLNGAEIFRDNLPAGAVGYGTLALSTIGPPLENEFTETTLSPALVPAGTNVLAVEIHQGAVDSSDISFDLELIATIAQPEPRVTLGAMGSALTLRWPALAGSYRLEQAINLTPPIGWRPVTNVIAVDGFWNSLALTNVSAGQRFFRLVSP